MDSLVTIIARQHELKFLNMQAKKILNRQGNDLRYELTEEQEQRIRNSIANHPECTVIITREEYDEYEAEQEQAQAVVSVPS